MLTLSRPLIVLYLLLPTFAMSDIICDNNRGHICLETEHNNNTVTFWAENRNALLPVTLSLSYTLTNLQASKGAEGPFVLRGGTRQKIASLKAKGNGRWSYNYTFEWSRGSIDARHTDSYLYRLPYASGKSFELSQGCNGASTHQAGQRYAHDFSMPVGTPILAARDGRVVAVKENSDKGGASAAYRNDGNYVIVEHDDRTLGQYFHLAQNGAAVSLAQTVQRGEVLGYAGNTGQSTGPHLHFDVIKGGKGIESESVPITFKTGAGAVRCPRLGARLVAVD